MVLCCAIRSNVSFILSIEIDSYEWRMLQKEVIVRIVTCKLALLTLPGRVYLYFFTKFLYCEFVVVILHVYTIYIFFPFLLSIYLYWILTYQSILQRSPNYDNISFLRLPKPISRLLTVQLAIGLLRNTSRRITLWGNSENFLDLRLHQC